MFLFVILERGFIGNKVAKNSIFEIEI